MTRRMLTRRAQPAFQRYQPPETTESPPLTAEEHQGQMDYTDILAFFENIEKAVHIVTSQKNKKQPYPATKKVPQKEIYHCANGAKIHFPKTLPLLFELVSDPTAGATFQIARIPNYSLKKHLQGQPSITPVAPDTEQHIASCWELTGYNGATRCFHVTASRTFKTAEKQVRIGHRIHPRAGFKHQTHDANMDKTALCQAITQECVALLGLVEGKNLIHHMMIVSKNAHISPTDPDTRASL